MASVRELVVHFGFEVDEKPLQDMERGIETLKTGFIAVAAAAGAAFGTIFGLAKSTANYADTIQDTAISIGVTNSELQKLAYASQLSGGGLETIADGMKFLARTSQEAIAGVATYTEAYNALGVSVTDANGKQKGSVDLLADLSDAFKRLGPGAKTTALAMDIFGRGGGKMIPMLIQGGDAIRAMGADAEAFGMILDDTAIQQGSDLNDALDTLKATALGIVRVLGAGLFPVVSEVTKAFQQWIVANREMIKQRLQKFIAILQTVLKDIWRVTYGVGRAFFALIGLFEKLTSRITWLVPLLKTMAALFGFYMAGKMAMALWNVAKGFIAIGRAAMAANLKVAAIPILIGAAIALVFLAVEDLFAFLDGRPSFLGFLVKNWPQIVSKMKSIINTAVAWARQAVGKVATALAEFVGLPTEKAKVFGETIVAIFDGIVGFIKWSLGTIWTMIAGIFEVIKTGINLLANGLVALVTDPVGAIIKFFTGGALDALMQFVGVVYEQGKRIFLALVEPLQKGFGFLKEKFGGLLGKMGINLDAAPANNTATGLDYTDAGAAVSPTPGQTLGTTNNAVSAPVNNNQNIQSTINVTVPPGANAQEIGGAVSKAANSEFDRILRQSKRATTPAVEY